MFPLVCLASSKCLQQLWSVLEVGRLTWVWPFNRTLFFWAATVQFAISSLLSDTLHGQVAQWCWCLHLLHPGIYCSCECTKLSWLHCIHESASGSPLRTHWVLALPLSLRGQPVSTLVDVGSASAEPSQLLIPSSLHGSIAGCPVFMFLTWFPTYCKHSLPNCFVRFCPCLLSSTEPYE